MAKRRRPTQEQSFKDRLVAFAEEARKKAKLAAGNERDALLRKARQADTAAHLDDWVSSSGLQPPE